MLQLQPIKTAQEIRIPRAVAVPGSGPWSFTLTNCITQHVQEFADITAAIDGQICVISVSLDDYTRGQYKYALRRGNAVISAGLAMVGFDTMRQDATRYNETKQIIQYNG